MAFVELIALSRCRKGEGTFIERGGKEFAVFILGDPAEAIVIDNACPHANGNLSGGEVSGTVVTCPWHHWQFDLCSGVCVDSPKARVRRYRAEIRDDAVWVELGSPG
jgi:nitrite reductase/ring-hydroxylating ferredoxin subunit